VRAAAALVVCAVLVACTAGTGEQCDVAEPIASASLFVAASVESAPIAPGEGIAACGPERMRLQPFGDEDAFEIDTVSGCGFGHVTQPSLLDIAAGDTIQLRVFYFAQTEFPADVARVALAVDGELFLDEEVEIPVASGLLPSDRAQRTAAQAHERGSVVSFAVGNHGDNSWNFLELTRVRRGPCPVDAP
jgi:hypothetical protein